MSNLTGFALGLFFIFLARYFFDKRSFFQMPVLMQLRKIYSLPDRNLIILATCALFILFSVLSIARHYSFSSGAYDLGIFDQAVWNTLKGDIMFSSIKMNMSLLGDHFEPMLFVFVPLYALWASPLVLLLAQSLLLAASIIPLYFICLEKLRSRFLIFVFIISFMLSKALRGIAFSDFHLEAFLVPLLLWAYYFLVKRKNWLLLVALLSVVFCKEDAFFLVSTFGLFAFFVQKRRVLGLTLFFSGIAGWILATKIFIPYFNTAHKYPYMDRLPFGITYADNFRAVLKHPDLLLKIFASKEKIGYIIQLLAPLGFISILSPGHLILLGIPILKNIFPLERVYQGYWGIGSHYTAMVIPFVYISAIAGANYLLTKIKFKNATIWLGVLLLLTSLCLYGKTDGNKLAKFIQGMRKYDSSEIISYLKFVPKDSSVSTNFNLIPHMSERKFIYEWNPGNPKTWVQEYIVLDEDLLEYAYPGESALKTEFDLKLFEKKGFRPIFTSPDCSFHIFKNMYYDQAKVEGIRPH